MPTVPTLNAAGVQRKLDVQPDVTDLRDRYYVPALIQLKQSWEPTIPRCYIRNQRNEGACTGFALAAVVDQQCKHMAENPVSHTGGDDAEPVRVSTRMLYEMAKLHDDTPGRDYSGSTIRGALKGFYHNGVCLEKDAAFFPDPDTPPWQLSVPLAKEARKITLGAYFRLHHEINDYHTAINEVGAIFVSAKIHSGWANPSEGRIVKSSRFEGRHAFAIVGYNSAGFIIQNSFGRRWGRYNDQDGLALWRYDDWAENVEDAWVLRLAISSPDAFEIKFARNHASLRPGQLSGRGSLAPRRQDVHGHFLHIDDGDLVRTGRYASTEDSIAATAAFLKNPASAFRPDAADAACKGSGYRHFALIAHGAMQDQFDVAKRIRTWKPVFKRNGVYPIHIVWETVFNTQISDVIADLLRQARKRMGTAEARIDEGLEALARPLGRKLWRDLVRSGALAFADGSEGADALRALVDGARNNADGPMKLHFISHSAGVHMLSSILPVMQDAGHVFETCNLLSPACSEHVYDKDIRPHVGKTIRQVNQYSLIDARERADQVDVYRKSLLYLVSNAIADKCGTKILGMEKFLSGDDAMTALPPEHRVFFAGRDRSVTDSKTHRGFDKDKTTMNHVLTQILDARPKATDAFSESELTGY